MKVSIVMTTYNGQKYLDMQIQSLLDQTALPDEILVCDDCSEDGTVDILERYQQLGKLVYVRNDRKLGLIENFKKVVSLAKKTNFVALCDQDDIWLPHKLESSISQFKNMEIAFPCMVHSDLILVDENNQLLNSSFRNELGQDKYQHNLQSLLFGNFVTGCTIVMNPNLRDFFSQMPAEIPFHDSWIALAAFSFGEVREIEEPLIRYRKHGKNLSIAAGTKPRNRYRSTMIEIFSALKGEDDFLADRLELISLFYSKYQNRLSDEKRRLFIEFLQLRRKSYFLKKLAFRRMVSHYRL